MVENSTAGLEMVAGEVDITVTREEQHQNVLARYMPRPGGERHVAVELAWCVVATGKYKGQRAIEVRLDGHRVGELTYLMSQRYTPLMTQVNAHGGRPGCEAVVERDARGLQLTLRLPRNADAAPTRAFPPAAHPTADTPTVSFQPVAAAATASASTFTRHKKAWIAAGAVTAVLFFAAIANGTEDPKTASPPAETTTTTVKTPTTTPTTTTTTPPPPTTTTTTTVVPPPPPVTQEPIAPPPVAEPPPQRQCDPNYTGCVPIASDVDCAGGSGNGPAYANGPVQVIGEDIYDLDRNNDSVACEE